MELIDLQGKYLIPAFIDVHIHGAYGSDAMDMTEEFIKNNFKIFSK